MKSEKAILTLVLLVVLGIVVLGIFGNFGFKGLESEIRESQSAVNRVIELEQRIAIYDNSISDLERREAKIGVERGKLDLREEKLNVRSREITISETNLIRRKEDLEGRIGLKLIELNRIITESGEAVKQHIDNYTCTRNDNNPGNDSTNSDP